MSNDENITCLFVLDQESELIYMKNSNSERVLSESELDEKLQSFNKSLEVIIILAELEWKGHYLQDFYGLEIAKKIRIEYNILCPILIYSSFSEKLLLEASISNLDFYKSPGLYYANILDASTTDDILENCDSISEETLIDITESFGKQESIISNAIHDLKNKRHDLLNALQERKRRSDINEIVKEQFNRVTLFFKGDEIAIERLKNSFIDTVLGVASMRGITDRISHLEEELSRLIPQNNSTNLRKYNCKWKILFLDDEKRVGEYVKDEFKKRGLICDLATNNIELDQYLKSDEQYNCYTVLICDYRLKESKKEKLSHKQGYSILKEVFLQRPNYLSLFALSSMNTKILLRIRERYNMKVWTFSKDDILATEGFNIFCSEIFERGEKMFNTICNLPGEEYKSWRTSDKSKRVQPFNLYYRVFRMSEDFETEEEKIGSEAKKLFFQRIGEKNSQSFQAVPPHSFDFKAGLTEGVTSKADLAKFKQKLIGRRAYLAFRFKGIMTDAKKVAAFLDKCPADKEKSDFNTDYFSSFLCMPEDMDRLPILLPEEKFWLKNDLGFDMEASNRITFNEIMDVIDDKYDGEILSIAELKQHLEKIDIGKEKEEIKNAIQNYFDQKKQKKGLHQEEYSDFRNRYAISGVLDLLKYYEIAPKKQTSDPITTSSRDSKRKKATSGAKKEKKADDLDPASPEGRAKIEGIDSLNSDFSIEEDDN